MHIIVRDITHDSMKWNTLTVFQAFIIFIRCEIIKLFINDNYGEKKWQSTLNIDSFNSIINVFHLIYVTHVFVECYMHFLVKKFNWGEIHKLFLNSGIKEYYKLKFMVYFATMSKIQGGKSIVCPYS